MEDASQMKQTKTNRTQKSDVDRATLQLKSLEDQYTKGVSYLAAHAQNKESPLTFSQATCGKLVHAHRQTAGINLAASKGHTQSSTPKIEQSAHFEKLQSFMEVAPQRISEARTELNRCVAARTQ